MWFIGVEVEQETSASLLKKSWIRLWGSFKDFSFPSRENDLSCSHLSNKWGGAFGTQGKQEINFSLDHDNFEAVFGRGFGRAIAQF